MTFKTAPGAPCLNQPHGMRLTERETDRDRERERDRQTERDREREEISSLLTVRRKACRTTSLRSSSTLSSSFMNFFMSRRSRYWLSSSLISWASSWRLCFKMPTIHRASRCWLGSPLLSSCSSSHWQSSPSDTWSFFLSLKDLSSNPGMVMNLSFNIVQCPEFTCLPLNLQEILSFLFSTFPPKSSQTLSFLLSYHCDNHSQQSLHLQHTSCRLIQASKLYLVFPIMTIRFVKLE